MSDIHHRDMLRLITLRNESSHHGYVFLGLPGNGSDSEIGKTPKKTNLFIGHGTNEWNYMGVYEFLLVEGREWMSKEEWRNLPNKVRTSRAPHLWLHILKAI